MITYAFSMPEQSYARFGPLSMNVCTSRTITDESVAAYMEKTLSLAKAEPTVVSLSYYLHDVPNARQRQAMVDALAKYGVAAPLRTVLLTDSAVMRGALTAFRWVTRAETDSFAPVDRRKALLWLAERAAFDVDAALARFDESCRELGVAMPASHVPHAGSR